MAKKRLIKKSKYKRKAGATTEINQVDDMLVKLKNYKEIVDGNSSTPSEEQIIDKTMKLEVLELKLGTQLLKLVKENDELLNDIKGIRNIVAAELGFVIPQIRISDDISLGQNKYSISLKKVVIAKGNIESNKSLVISEIDGAKIKGKRVKEPMFNLDGIWIVKEDCNEALNSGLTVIDAHTIISIHLYELIKLHADEIITIQDLVDILERMKCNFPIIVEEAMKVTTFKVLLKICKDLLHEGIPIIDMVTILEATTYFSQFTKSYEVLLEHVRSKLFRLITNKYLCSDGKLHVLKIKPELELDILNKIQEQSSISKLLFSIPDINNLLQKTKEFLEHVGKKWIDQVVIVVDSSLRSRLSEIYKKYNIQIAVLSDDELDVKANIIIEGNLSW